MSAEPLIRATVFHDIAFHGKNYLLLCCGTQPLLHDVLCIFCNLPTSAAHVWVPIDYKAIQLIVWQHSKSCMLMSYTLKKDFTGMEKETANECRRLLKFRSHPFT